MQNPVEIASNFINTLQLFYLLNVMKATLFTYLTLNVLSVPIYLLLDPLNKKTINIHTHILCVLLINPLNFMNIIIPLRFIFNEEVNKNMILNNIKMNRLKPFIILLLLWRIVSPMVSMHFPDLHFETKKCHQNT